MTSELPFAEVISDVNIQIALEPDPYTRAAMVGLRKRLCLSRLKSIARGTCGSCAEEVQP